MRPGELAQLLLPQLVVERPVERAAVVELGLALHPKPELRAGDLRGRGVLHQIEDGDRAVAAQPRGEILQRHADVVAHASLGDLAAGYLEIGELLGAHLHVLAQPLLLVRLAQLLVEDFLGDGHEIGMRHPGAVEAVADLAQLVLAGLGQGDLVDLRILARRNEGGHAAHRVSAALVAGGDEQLAVGAHERHGHGQLRPVGEPQSLAPAQLLDQGEEIIPAAGVEAAHVIAQLVEDLVHLEGGGQRLDQDCGADGPARQAESLLRSDEDVVPQPRLEVRLDLGQIEVWPRAALDHRPRVVEEAEPEVGERGGDGLALHEDVLLVQVPAARPHQERGDLVVELVLLSFRRGEGQGAADRVHQIDVADDDVRPGGRESVLEVGHEDVGAGVERVDHHLALDRAGDLDVPLLQIGRSGGNLPVAFAHALRLGEELEFAAAPPARGEQLLAGGAEAPLEAFEEGERLLREHLVDSRDLLPSQLDGSHGR